jgi:hypothetical protein
VELLVHAIAKINKQIDFTSNEDNKINELKKMLQSDPLTSDSMKKLNIFPGGRELSLEVAKKLAQANEHILIVRQ